MTDLSRASRLLSFCDSQGVGLEIGPLCSPLVTRDAYPLVKYADYACRDDLIAASSGNPAVCPSGIPHIDYICPSIDDIYCISEQLNFVVASHVIEHVPDFFGWLNAISSMLLDGGLLILAVPDRRYCFDYFRTESTFGDVMEAFWMRRRKPSARQVLDAFSLARHNDSPSSWHSPPNSDCRHVFSLDVAFELGRQAAVESSYIDCHCWVFTYESFLELIELGKQKLVLSHLEVHFSSPPILGRMSFMSFCEKFLHKARSVSFHFFWCFNSFFDGKVEIAHLRLPFARVVLSSQAGHAYSEMNNANMGLGMILS